MFGGAEGGDLGLDGLVHEGAGDLGGVEEARAVAAVDDFEGHAVADAGDEFADVFYSAEGRESGKVGGYGGFFGFVPAFVRMVVSRGGEDGAEGGDEGGAAAGDEGVGGGGGVVGRHAGDEYVGWIEHWVHSGLDLRRGFGARAVFGLDSFGPDTSVDFWGN